MSLELDIEPIRSRLTRAGKFSLPRWVVTDMSNLLSEIERLRAGAPPSEYATELRKLQSRVWVLERDLARQKEAAQAERASVLRYLREFATNTPPGPVSPVRRSAQAFASRAAAIVEKGEHLTSGEGA